MVQDGSVKDASLSFVQLFAASPKAATYSALSNTLQRSAVVQAQSRLAESLANSPRVAQGVVQRKLVVEGEDYTERYNEAENKQAVLEEAESKLLAAVEGEPELSEAVKRNLPAIRNQLKKWIEDLPGFRGPEESTTEHSLPHRLYGRKEQDRAYPSWKELAQGLLGWGEAKPIRRSERELAEDVYASKPTEVLLDSLINKLYIKIMALTEQGVDPQQVADIHRELTTGISAIATEPRGGKIGHYREFYEELGARKGEQHRSGVPENRLEMMANPGGYTIKAKITLLHDLMEYFGKHQPWNPKVRGQGLMPPETPEQTRVTTQINEQGERTASVSASLGTEVEKKKARGMGLTTSTRDETAESTMLARRLNLPVWAGQSTTTVRMLNLADWAGADVPEKTALVMNLFANWRLEYDHTSKYAYHTLHEVRDMAQNFGVLYKLPTQRLERGFGNMEIEALNTFRKVLDHAFTRFVELVNLTEELKVEVGDNYVGPNAARIQAAFKEIQEVADDVRRVYLELDNNLQNRKGTDEENVRLLRRVLFQLNRGLNLQDMLKRLLMPQQQSKLLMPQQQSKL